LIERDLWIEKGTCVGGFSAANEAIETLIMHFETEDQMDEVLSNQGNYVKVILK